MNKPHNYLYEKKIVDILYVYVKNTCKKQLHKNVNISIECTSSNKITLNRLTFRLNQLTSPKEKKKLGIIFIA